MMASITNASAVLRIRSTENRAVCSINGVDPAMICHNQRGAQDV